MRRDENDTSELMTAAARVHTSGSRIHWHALHAGTGARRVDLPTYPFQRQHFWLATPGTGDQPRPPDASTAAGRHDGLPTADPPAPWSAQLALMPTTQREGAVLDIVRTHLGAVLGYPDPAGLDPRASFLDLGVDSMTAVRFCAELGRATGTAVPPAAVFDYPTCQQLARHVLHIGTADLGEFAQQPTTRSDWDPDTIRSATAEQLFDLLDKRKQTSGARDVDQ